MASTPNGAELAAHHLRESRRRTAGGDRLELDAGLLLEPEHDHVRGRADGGKGDGPAVGLLEAFDRGIGRNVKIGVVRAGHGRADDADRRTLGISPHDTQRAEPNAEVGAAGDHRLQRLARTLRIENVERDPVLLKDTGVLREFRDRLVPDSLGADRELQCILRQGERVSREQDDDCNQAHVRRVQHFLVSPRDNMVHIQPHKGRNVTGKATWTSSFRKN